MALRDDCWFDDPGGDGGGGGCSGGDLFAPGPPDPFCYSGPVLPPPSDPKPPQSSCTLQLGRRPAKFKGDPGQHTYLDLCTDGTDCQIVEGGRDNNQSDPTFGDLIG